MKYRADIDGLRSLAILPVVAYHSGISVASGGFTGVDIFFVISGYLITGIILAEIRENDFSILNFYKRRALRILPALTLVILVVAVASFAFMLPNEFLATGRSIIATALFVSNIHFWRESGYFDAAADLKPLLHTWSLAVEEQFYLFFPILLIGIARWLRRRFLLWIGLMALVSFAMSVIGLRMSPAATFYLLPPRMWELGIGALIAAGGAPQLQGTRGRGMAVWVGVMLIVYGVFGLSEENGFPGWNALFPCVGAGLVIAYGAGTTVSGILGWRPLVYIGRISYSLYLWHWPVIVFYRMLYGGELDPRATVTVVTLSFALAVLSYHFVETPFRSARFRAAAVSRVLWGGATAVMASVAVGGAIAGTGGSWRTYPGDVLRIAAYTDYTNSPDYRFQFGQGTGCATTGYRDEGGYNAAKCLVVRPDRKNVVVIGDSHAAAVWRAISLAFPETNFIEASVSGCRPLLDAEGEAACRETFNHIYRDFLPNHHLDGVIMVGRWRETDLPKVAPTIEYLKDYVKKIVVFGPTVEYKGEFPLLLAREKLNHVDGLTENAIDLTKKGLSDDLGRVVASEKVGYVGVYDALCDKGTCLETTPDGAPMQFDYGHLTLGGSELLIGKVREKLDLGG